VLVKNSKFQKHLVTKTKYYSVIKTAKCPYSIYYASFSGNYTAK